MSAPYHSGIGSGTLAPVTISCAHSQQPISGTNSHAAGNGPSPSSTPGTPTPSVGATCADCTSTESSRKADTGSHAALDADGVWRRVDRDVAHRGDLDQLRDPLPEEFSRVAYDAAKIVTALMEPVCVHARRWSPGFDLTVAVPVVVGKGVAVADGAPQATAVGITFSGDDATGLRLLDPGDRLKSVGGTNGHLGWPPATEVFEVLSGSLAGSVVQFVLDPDPRPAGESAVTASAVLLRCDEPVLADAVQPGKPARGHHRCDLIEIGDLTDRTWSSRKADGAPCTMTRACD